MSESEISRNFNVRSPWYFIAHTLARCIYCRELTRFFGLALPPEHETLELDAEAETDELANDVWDLAGVNAFLFFISHLPDSVKHKISQFSSRYRPGTSQTLGDSYWMNHCEICGLQQEEEGLFWESEGPFTPIHPEAAAAVELIIVREPFAARSSGYIYAPELFEVMTLV